MTIMKLLDQILICFFILTQFILPSTHGFLGNNIFKTGDTRLFDTFCVSNVKDLDSIGRKTHTHESITLNGIKKSLLSLFVDLKPDYIPPNDYEQASLTEIFQSYYGQCASPDRFLDAVLSIIKANVALDSQPGLKENPALHFDAEAFEEAKQLLYVRNNQINIVAGDGKFSTMRNLLGKSLHSMQKFYAHSNWVEMGNDAILDLIWDDFGNLASNKTDTCHEDDLTVDVLTSGYFHYNEIFDGVAKCGHGSILDENDMGGINKDTSSVCFSPHAIFHENAARLAEEATFQYLEDIRKTIQNDKFQSLLSLSKGSALAVAIDTSFSMQQEINAVKKEILDIINEVNAGGISPSVYILAPYANETKIDLTITKDTNIVESALEKMAPDRGPEEYVFHALQATYQYLEEIRKTIQNEAYQSLLSLSLGSALAIALDTSDSMENEIAAVKKEVLDIIDAANEGGIIPSVYILAPYEASVDLTITKDTEKVKQVLNGLVPNGGTENVFTALRAILSNAPDFTDILVFTDEPGDDPQLQDTVISLAKNKKCKINVIWTEANPVADALQTTCQETGGLFIESSKVDVADIVALLSQSIKTSEATMAIQTGITNNINTPIYVDSSIDNNEYRIHARVSGNTETIILKSPSEATIVDMADDSSIAASGLNIEIIYRGPSLLDFTYKPNEEGVWHLDVTPINGQIYSTEISAICTFSFLSDFDYLDLNTTHPTMQVLPGQPISSSTPYISVRMTAVQRSKIGSVEYLSMVTPQGNLLHSYTPVFLEGFEETFIVDTKEFRMPNVSFYLRLDGKDNRGNDFQRIKPVLISPATTYVEVTPSSSSIEVEVCDQADAEFNIYNYGPATSIQVEISDDLGFLDSSSSFSVTIAENSSTPITATFKVPCDATVGDVSTIVVTATSDLDGTQNSAVTRLVVISDEEDNIPPQYEILSETGCSSNIGFSNCDTENWALEAIVHDNETGLRIVGVDFAGEGILNIDTFTVGTNDNVFVVLNATCCVRKALLSMIDVAGNANRAEFNKGPLKDCGQVTEKSVTDTSVSLNWNCPCQEWAGVDRYEFEFEAEDGQVDFTHTSRTSACDNNDFISNLRSCMKYTMTMTAYQLAGNGEEEYRQVDVTTLEGLPNAPTIISTVSKTPISIEIEWYPPVSIKECVHHYRLCYKIDVSDVRKENTFDEICLETEHVNDTAAVQNFNLTNLEPCATYRIRIAAVTPLGQYSVDVRHTERTENEVPGEPSLFGVLNVDRANVYLGWNRPEINRWCVQRYVLSFFAYDQDEIHSSTTMVLSLDDTSTTTTGTSPWTPTWTPTIPPDPTTMSTSTLETTSTTAPSPTTTSTTTAPPTTTPTTTAPPTKPTTTSTTTTTTTSSSTTTMPTTTEDIFADYDFGDVVENLQFCVYYNFTLYSEAFDGLGSSEIVFTNSVTENTDKMNPPSLVTVEEVTETSMKVNWFPPEGNSKECLTKYEVQWNNLDNPDEFGVEEVDSEKTEVYLSNLKPCVRYGITVRSIAQDIFASSAQVITSTKDVTPGMATKLRILETFSDGFRAEWCPPNQNPQCARTWDWNTRVQTDERMKNQNKRYGDEELCPTIQQRELDCNTDFSLTVWAYSPEGKEGERLTTSVKTQPCEEFCGQLCATSSQCGNSHSHSCSHCGWNFRCNSS